MTPICLHKFKPFVSISLISSKDLNLEARQFLSLPPTQEATRETEFYDDPVSITKPISRFHHSCSPITCQSFADSWWLHLVPLLSRVFICIREVEPSIKGFVSIAWLNVARKLAPPTQPQKDFWTSLGDRMGWRYKLLSDDVMQLSANVSPSQI